MWTPIKQQLPPPNTSVLLLCADIFNSKSYITRIFEGDLHGREEYLEFTVGYNNFLAIAWQLIEGLPHNYEELVQSSIDDLIPVNAEHYIPDAQRSEILDFKRGWARCKNFLKQSPISAISELIKKSDKYFIDGVMAHIEYITKPESKLSEPPEIANMKQDIEHD